MTVIHWFRRDLRVNDNVALNAAVAESSGSVVPVFVFDDALLKGTDVAPARVQFLLESLRELDANLHKRGSQLVVRRGNVAAELVRLAQETGASAITYNRDYTPAARKRDTAVDAALQAVGVATKRYKDLVLHEEHELLTNSKKPYTVFTPYKKAWLAADKPKAQTSDWRLAVAPIANLHSQVTALSSAKELGFAVTQQVPKGGEAEAARLLKAFVDSDRLNRYAADRDFPGLAGTALLSPHLRFGTISPRVCYETAQQNINYVVPARESRSTSKSESDIDSGNAWISELIWREFYMQVLFHHPHADKGNFNKTYDAFVWGNGSAQVDQQYFKAWCAGKTGFPIVDAAMRQLNATGWMHNRCRMIVASFLTKDLLLDWRWGESYFMRMLVDGDPASNNGGWQWAASTGTDAQPYFRIFNPLIQAAKFDPQGAYIRQWLPELARVPAEFVHEPWNMPPQQQLKTNCVIGQTYPKRIVDHAAQKEKMLERFKAVKG
jgi:deoxyribodipyrimidine photo-lyase